MDSPEQKTALPLVGISSCLMGMRVRYDGQHRFQNSIEALIAPHVNLLPLCPESMAGMGIPRKPVNLVETADGIRAIGRDDPDRDVTERLRTMGKIVGLTYPNLCGYILQSRSPSCGFYSTPIYSSDQASILQLHGHGLFVKELLKALPDLPILDDTELTPTAISQFISKASARALAFANH